ncbi:hypothetical protein N7528_001667 [Penicillium herquei]|nr:hypothetical protein N7528_001667 [Penicillium herquei]
MENPASLTDISALVERTLLDTGRLFRKSGSMPASTHLQRSLPSYYDSFQEALDNLSEQIFIAKAYLEKDYEAIKAREVVPVTEDVTMSEVDQNQNVGQETEPNSLKMELVSETANVQPKTEPEVAAPTEATPAPQPSQNPIVKEEPQAKADVPMEQSFPDANEGLNFDSVLNEGGSGSFNLSLDFGDDDMGNQAFLSGSAFSNVPGDSKTSASQPPENSTTTASAGGGAFDMELQKSEGGSNAFPDQGNAMDDLMAPGESSFDDLFMENENLGGDSTEDLNQLEGDSLMNLNELEDNWFT